MALQNEIEQYSREIHTDAYAMSVGELLNMYENGELDIHPEFQRFYRWDRNQKSRLIESILIGIPLPSIFVAQRQDGVWDVIDGLQRLSTIFQLAGILKDEHGDTLPPLQMASTKYLPSLGGKVWDEKGNGDTLTVAQRLFIKRAKVDVKIIKKESTEETKYDLFQRLNTGGSQLTDQEIRNCILLSIDRDGYQWLKGLQELSDFQACVAISDRARDEQYDMELALRFILLVNADDNTVRGIGDIGEYLTDTMAERAMARNIESRELAQRFKDTFSILASTLASDSFRRYEPSSGRFTGGFLISGFEAVALGIGHNHQLWTRTADLQSHIEQLVKHMWEDVVFLDGIGSGRRASQRMPVTIPYGRRTMIP